MRKALIALMMIMTFLMFPILILGFITRFGIDIFISGMEKYEDADRLYENFLLKLTKKG